MITFSRAFQQYFEVTRNDVVGRPVYAMGQYPFHDPELRTLLETVLPQDNAFQDVVMSAELPQGGQRTLRLSGRRIIGEDDATPLILLVIDIINGSS